MVISTEGRIEFRITNNNTIDMHVGKRVRLMNIIGMNNSLVQN